MHFLTLATLLVAGSATTFAAAWPKANEYKSAFMKALQDAFVRHSTNKLSIQAPTGKKKAFREMRIERTTRYPADSILSI